MANQTVKDAISIKGTNPQYLVEKIVRTRIYDSRYWKEECFGLTAELIVDKAMELKSIGGIYGGNVKPSPFLCLILKMLQIQPEKDIIVEFIRNEDFKYMRALGAFYMRLTGSAPDVYKYLEPLYIDYRKMKRMNKNAKYELIHMDEFIDELLHSERVCDVSLPRLQKRHVLEETNELEPRISPLEVNLDEADSDDEDEEEEEDEDSETSSIADNNKGSSKRSKEKRDQNRHGKKDDRGDDESRHARKRGDDSRERDRKRKERGRYVDYDRPDEEDLKLYERRRERTPERSSSRRDESSKKSRGSSRDRDRDRGRDHDRDRDRDRGGGRSDRDRERERNRSRERERSRDRRDDKKSKKRGDRSKERSSHH